MQYQKTKDGVVTKIYSSQRGNSKRRGYNPPTYTKQELKYWLYSQDLFHKLFDKWVLSNYDTFLKPSVDRLDDYKSYCMDNIRLVTWRENKIRHYEDRKTGVCNKINKAVFQFTIDDVFIDEFHSLNEAERGTNVYNTDIGKCCLGKRKTVGGFKWKYKEERI